MKIMRAESMDALLLEDIQVSFAQVGDSGPGGGLKPNPKEYHTGVTGQTVIVMPNGDLIVPMYGQFKADTTKLSYFRSLRFLSVQSVVCHFEGQRPEFFLSVHCGGRADIPL